MRKLLEYGFTDYSGATWADSQVDSYNAVQRAINQFEIESLPVPEYLINGSHHLFRCFSDAGRAKS